MKYGAYLFDLDGTLYSRDALVQGLIEEQRQVFENELSHIESQVYVDRVIALDAHGYHPKEQLYAQIAQEWDLSPGVQSKLLEHFWDTYNSHCILPEDSHATLSALHKRGVRLAVVTNGQTNRQNRKIDALGIRDYFHAILISDAEGLKKPQREIFHRAVARCGVSPDEAVFIGDHPIADIDGARDAGLAAIWKKVPYWDMTRTDVRVVAQLVEILD